LGDSYQVTFYTGDEYGAGTNANVKIKLYGERGISSVFQLPYKRSYFERKR